MIKTPLSTAIGGVGMYTKNSLIIGGGKTEPPFDPASLFENGEIGTLLDATDLSTIYRDAAGLITTTAEQPIGLILDNKRNISSDIKNLFTTMSSGVVTQAYFNKDSGDGTVSRVDSANQSYLHIDTSKNTWYVLKIKNTSSANLAIRSVFNLAVLHLIRPNEENTYILHGISSLDITTAGVAFENMTFKISFLKVIDGFHAHQATSAARPLLQNNIKFDGIDDALNIAFPSALTNCTIFTVKHGQQAQILEAQSVAQNHTINQDFKYYGIVNRALTSAERTGLTRFLNKLGAQ